MTDAEPNAPPHRSEESTRPAGTALALVALLIALGTAAFVGYRAWQGRQAEAEAQAALKEHRTAHASLAERFAGDLATLDANVAKLQRSAESAELERRALREWQAQREQAAAARADAAPTQAPAEAWQAAEAEYLLRVANYRVRLEADASGALRMLAAADQALADADPFAYHDVRALLAKEQAALAAVAGTDVQGIFLRLAALKDQLRQLPLRLPAYIVRDADEAPPAAATALDAVIGRLAGLVRFRSTGPPVPPLLPPEQAEYLQLHLRLALNHAQLAALRRDQAVFAASLAAASKWLAAYVDMRAEASRAFAAALDALQGEDLAADLPDISGSLARLRARRSVPEDGE